MNQSEKEIFVRFLREEIQLINDRYKALTEPGSEVPELNVIKEKLQHLQQALNAVEKSVGSRIQQ